MLRARDLAAEETIGQLLWIGFDGLSLDPAVERLLREVRPGGVILFGRNIGSASQVRALTDALHRAIRLPPFIALDQEGGRVNRLRPILGATPASLALAGRPDAEAAVRRHGAATAAALRSLGFNVNFAPVLDLSGADPGNGIGDRGFGEDPARVSSLAEVFVRIHLRAGVLPVGKHFPGLGAARADTHLTLPVIRRPRALLWRRDLLPYRRLRRLLPMVMVGHAFYPALQGGRPGPATLSPAVVTALLRRRIGFRGLVLTDDLEMGAVNQGAGGAALALAALRAGSDGLMFSRSEERIREAFEGLCRAAADGTLPAGRLRAPVRRILALKQAYLAGRRRPRYSPGALARARLLMESLGGAAEAGPDPTARA
jgi:beta-N-acetylhexosaminidase